MDEEGNHIHTTISERCRDTRQQFVGLLSEIEDHQPQKAVLSDSLERFMLWAGNLGAMRQPSSRLSLDQRLFKAPEVHDLICQHVDDIREAVGDLSGVLLQDGVPGDDDEETLGPDPDAEEPFDEAGMLLEVIAEAISSLFRLGILVRKSSPTDRFKRALQMSDISFNDTLDIGHVRDKHPKMRDPAKDWLCTRLGRLISKRRLFIKYSRDHRARLEYQEPLRGDVSEEHATQTQRQSSKATTFHPDRLPVSVLAPAPADFEDVPQLEEEDIDKVVSVMSASTMSNALSVLKLPTLADLSVDGQAFECPICFTLQHFQREKAWKVHAFRDLKAYVCTAGGADRCNEEYFGDRNTWFEHELHYHRAQYICAVCQDLQPVAYSVFAQHMTANHPQISGNHLKAIEEVSRQIPTQFDANDCPFCDDWAEQIRQKADPKGKRPDLPTPFSDGPCMVSATRFKRHVALHQEQLAIFALPRMGEDGDQADHGGTDKSIVSSESASTDQSQVSRDPLENPGSGYAYRVAKKILSSLEKGEIGRLIDPNPTYSTEYTDFLNRIALRMQNVQTTGFSFTLNVENNLLDLDTHIEEFVSCLQALEECRHTEIERLAVETGRMKRSPILGFESYANLCLKVASEVRNTIDLANAWFDYTDFEKIIPGWRATDEDASRMKLQKAWDELAAIIAQHNLPSLKRPTVKLVQTHEPQTDLNIPDDPPPTGQASTARTADLITIRSPAIHKTLELDPGCSWQEADAIIKAAHGNKDNDDQPGSEGQALVQQGRYTLTLVGPKGSYFKTVDQSNWKNLVEPGSFLRVMPAFWDFWMEEKDERSVVNEPEREKIEDEGGAPVGKAGGEEQEELGGDNSRNRFLIDDRMHRQQGIADGKMEEPYSSITQNTVGPTDANAGLILLEKAERLLKAAGLLEGEADPIEAEKQRVGPLGLQADAASSLTRLEKMERLLKAAGLLEGEADPIEAEKQRVGPLGLQAEATAKEPRQGQKEDA